MRERERERERERDGDCQVGKMDLAKYRHLCTLKV